MTSPYKRPSSVQTHVKGNRRLNVNSHPTLLKAVNLPVKYFVCHILLPYADPEVFRKHTKKKSFEYTLPAPIFRVFSINGFHIHLLGPVVQSPIKVILG